MSFDLERESKESLWLLLPKLGVLILVTFILTEVCFWLRFSEINEFSFGFAAFLSLLQILMIVGSRFAGRGDIRISSAAPIPWLDMIGRWWLVACFIGAFFGWICGQGVITFPTYATVFLVAKVFFTIILPVITMLPLIRYVGGNSAYIQIPLLITVTMFPILTGIDALIRLIV